MIATSDAVKQEGVARRHEHQETMGLFCQVMRQQQPAYVCLNGQRGDIQRETFTPDQRDTLYMAQCLACGSD